MARVTRILAWVCAVAVLPVQPLTAQSAEADRIREAARVLGEIAGAPDGGVPRAILARARAVVIFPSTLKGGLLVGGHFGRGVIVAHDRAAGRWSAPAFVTLTGGSLGAQIGGQAVDLVLVVINDRGLDRLARNSFKIGGDASVAAGPVGREAEAATDATFRAEILSYSRSRGLFAGVTLKGSTIRADREANERFYGHPFTTRDIVIGHRADRRDPVPTLIAALARWVP